MRLAGITGVVRGRHTTVTTRRDGRRRGTRTWSSAAGTPRPATDQLWVADFSYVWTLAGFVYVAFVVDVFSRRILGWRVDQLQAHPAGHRRPAPSPDHPPHRANPLDAAGLDPSLGRRRPGRIQPVVATPACWSESSCSLSASAGVFQPRVLRGRLLRACGDGFEVVGGSSGTGRCPWGSTGAAGRWCSRSCRAARGCAGRRSRPRSRCRS